MSQPPRPVARHVPTLTEVIEVQPQALSSPEIDVPLAMPDTSTGAVHVEALPGTPVLSEPVAESFPQSLVPSAPPPAPASPVVPSLTEVDRAVIPRSMLSDAGFQAVVGASPTSPISPLMQAPLGSAAANAPAPVAIDEQAIVQKVHADLQRQIDGMLEYRLREAIGPILARTSELLVRELRQELGKTMKDVVARSVAQEIARQRSRSGS